MAALLEAVDTSGTVHAAQVPVVEAVEVTVLNNTDQTIAGPEHVAALRQIAP